MMLKNIVSETRARYQKSSVDQAATGDERYAWLNRIQAVAKGTFTPEGTLIYEMYELR